MSRTGPYACLLLALLLLFAAVVPPAVPAAALGALGAAPDRAEVIAARVEAALALAAGGLVLVALAWMLRIGRLEAALAPWREALADVAAPLGARVEVDGALVARFRTEVGHAPVEVVAGPLEGLRLVADCRAMAPFLVQRNGEAEPRAGWPVAAGGRAWVLRAPRPADLRWLGRDAEAVPLLDRVFDGGLVRAMGFDGRSAEVRLDVDAPEQLPRAFATGLEAVAAARRLADRVGAA